MGKTQATANGRGAARAAGGGGLGERLELQAEQQLLRQALEKVKRGAVLNIRETRAIRKHEEATEERHLLSGLRRMPQKLVRAVFGNVQTKQLQDFQVRWDLPFAQPIVDWFELGPRLWAVLVKFGKQKPTLDPESELLAGASKNVKDEYVRQQTRIARLKADEMEKKAIYWDELQPALVDLGTGLRKAGEIVQRQYGAEPARVYDEALDEFERKLDQLTAAGTEARGHEGTEEQP